MEQFLGTWTERALGLIQAKSDLCISTTTTKTTKTTTKTTTTNGHHIWRSILLAAMIPSSCACRSDAGLKQSQNKGDADAC